MTIETYSRALRAPGEDDGARIGEGHVHTDVFGLRFTFTAPRGYNVWTGKDGQTVFTLRPDGGSFAEIAKAMMKANPDAAIRAFGVALSDGLPAKEQASKTAA